MVEYLNLLFSSQNGSIFLYTLLVVLSTFFAHLSQPVKYYGTTAIKKQWFLLSFLTLWIFLAFTANGTDTEWYKRFFDNYNSFKECHSGPIELGFQYLNAAVHLVTNNAVFFIVLIRTISLILIFVAIYKLREKSILWLAVLGFTAIIYFQMYSALRNSIAYALGFYAYALCVKKHNVAALIICLIGFAIHRSMAFFFLNIVVYIFVTKVPIRIIGRIIIPLMLLAIIILYFRGSAIIEYLVMSENITSGKYESYLSGESTRGIMVFINYLPIAYVLYKFKNAKKLDSDFYFLNVITTFIGFAFALIAYQIGQLSRLAPYFALPFLFYIGNYLLIRTAQQTKDPSSQPNQLFNLLLIVYWFFRFMNFIGGIYYNNGLDNYHFFEI